MQLLVFVGKEGLIEEVKEFIMASVCKNTSCNKPKPSDMSLEDVLRCCTEVIKTAKNLPLREVWV